MGRRARQAAQRARDIKDLVTYWPLATAGTHFPGEGWQVRVEGVATGLPWRSLGSLCPSSGSGEQDGAGAGGGFPACCLLFLEVHPPHPWAGRLSQVECFETGSGELLQTEGETTKPCERRHWSTKEPESRSCRESSRIPNFCLGSRKHSKEKKGKSLYVSTQRKEVGFALTTERSGSYFYGGKILTQSECCWWQWIREDRREGN